MSEIFPFQVRGFRLVLNLVNSSRRNLFVRPLRIFFSPRWAGSIVAVLLLALFAGCRPSVPDSEGSVRVTEQVNLVDYLEATPVGQTFEGQPWITHTNASDLDQDGKTDVLFCDAKENSVGWLRQTEQGWIESTLATEIAAPVHVEPSDIDQDGDLDLLIASMGLVFPNNDKIGSVVILENDGTGQFTKRVIIDQIARVTDVRAGDFDGDGRIDLAVGQFGYDQGEIRWMRNVGGWRFESHMLLHLSGTINVCVADLNGDSHLDIAALVSQQWEEIYLFEGDGEGNFEKKVIFGSTNEDFGSSGMALYDLNRDGRLDILYSNGDGFDYARPGPRPWHGVQWLENRGNGFFAYQRVGDFAGAHCPVGVDLDQDGDMDVVAVSAFNEWDRPQAASMMLFENDGRMNFTPRVLARTPTHLLTCVAVNLDDGGAPALMTGGFHAYPPWDRMSRLMDWRRGETP